MHLVGRATRTNAVNARLMHEALWGGTGCTAAIVLVETLSAATTAKIAAVSWPLLP